MADQKKTLTFTKTSQFIEKKLVTSKDHIFLFDPTLKCQLTTLQPPHPKDPIYSPRRILSLRACEERNNQVQTHRDFIKGAF